MEDVSRQRQLRYGSQYRPVARSDEPFYENYSSTTPTDERRTLPRTISAADIHLTDQYESVVKRDYVPNPPLGGTSFFANTPMFTLTLPVIENRVFQDYVLDILQDSDVNRNLEGERIINWCNSLPTLTPLNTIRDGNCLLHAASLGMWGFQDRNLFLRHALNKALECKTQNTFFSRWKFSREVENSRVGLTLDPETWDQEWLEVKSRSTTDVVTGKNLDSLEDFHVFVLANVLRRPIIMYASPKFRSPATGGTLQEMNFSGIYLPLLWDPSVCKRCPLPLVYSKGHFSALVMMESPDQYNRGQLVLPLAGHDGLNLPVKFFIRMENPNTLVREYLDITEVKTSTFKVPCCKLTIPEAKSSNSTCALVNAFILCCKESFAQESRLQAHEPYSERQLQCRNGCGRLCEANISGYCAKCYQQSRDFDYAPQERLHMMSSPQNFRNSRIGDQPQPKPRSSVQSGGRGTVKCSECSEPGLPQYLGRCERCHKRIQSNNDEDIYEPLPSPPTGKRSSGDGSKPPSLPLPRNQSERSNCRTPGCDFFGTKETRFYCSKCFESNFDNIVKEAEKSPALPPASGSSSNLFEPRGVEQPAQKSGSDTNKCPSCWEFFGSPELNGLCNKCFLKSTEVPEGKQLQDSSAQSRSKDTKREEVVPCGRDAASDSQIYSKPQSKLSRAEDPGDSGSVYKLTSQMGSVNIQEECVMCNGDRNIDGMDSDAFVLCRKHAKELLRNGQGLRESDDRQKRMSASAYHGDDSQHYSSRVRDNNTSFTQSGQDRMHGGYGGNFLEDQYQPVRKSGSSFVDDQYQPVRKSGSSFDSQGLPPPVVGDYTAHVRQNNASFYQRGECYAGEADEGRSHRGRDALGGSGAVERDRYRDRGGGGGGGGNGVGGFGGREWEEQPPQGNAMERERFSSSTTADWNNAGRGMRAGAGGRVEDRFGGNMAGAFDGDQRGGGAGKADSGRGGASGGDYNKPITGPGKLCKIPGCSFYAYRDLNNYCPDCFEETYKQPVDRDRYPST